MPALHAVAEDVRPQTPSPEALRLALKAAQAGIWEWDVETNHNVWSAEIWSLYGIPPDAPPCFDSWIDSVHPDDRACCCQTVVAACHRGEPFELEWRTNPERGEVRWLMSRGQPMPTRAGHRSYAGIVLDITARRRAEDTVRELNARLEQRVQERSDAVQEHERLLQTILDGIPGLVGYWTRDLHNRFANRTYAEWFGLKPDAMRGMHITDLLGPTLFARNKPYIDAVLAGYAQCFQRDIPIPEQPGQVRCTEAHYVPDVVNGQVQGFLAIVFDISQAKRAERAAEAASSAKSDFLANISHEVRTPLNAMFGLAQLGARQAQGTATQRTFDQILESAQHLLALVNDVLDFSKIEAGKLSLQQEQVNLAQVLEHVLSLKAIKAQAKGLQFRVMEGPDVPRYCVSDATRLSQILLNLLSNAIRYTDHGEVWLRVDVEGDQLCLDVSDSGIGMSRDQLAQLFKPFVQVHSRQARREGGTGLGLAITHRLVELMEGRIDVDSEPQGGSRFRVRIPLHAPVPARFEGIEDIALVGLEAESRESLQLGLSHHGCKVQCLDSIEARSWVAASVVVLSPLAMQHSDEARLLSIAQAGGRLLLNSPAGVALDLPQSLQPHMLVLAGPLTPLRLLNAVDRQLHRPQTVPTQRLKGLHVLAAEDNPVNRLVLAQMLEQEGATVTFAHDGAQALEISRLQGTDRFNVVLCDIQMPVLDGYQVAQALNRIAPDLPIIGLTAHAFASARQQAREVGMVDYVTKPYLLDTLVHAIRQHARSAHPAVADITLSSPPPSLSSAEIPSHPATGQGASDFAAMQLHFKAQPLLLQRLIGMLHRTLADLDLELRRCLSQRDMTALAKTAHNLKGTALNLHAPELSRLAVQTQDLARVQNDNAWAAAMALQTCLNEFMDETARHLETS